MADNVSEIVERPIYLGTELKFSLNIEDTPASGSTPAVYKFDVYQGFIDLSNYATVDEVETLSTAEIQSICS